MAVLDDLRDRENPMDLDRARTIAKVADALIDSARVEIEFLKVTGQETSQFLTPPVEAPRIEHTPESGYTQGDIVRINGVTRHTLRG